jgi:hypothetical protein
MIRKVNADARRVIADHFNQHGVVPKLAEFAVLMGYRSESSAQWVLQQLVRDQFLAQESTGKRRYIPGPLFNSKPGKTALPPELLSALPSGDNLKALVVDARWLPCEQVCLHPGDLVVVAEVSESRSGAWTVFRRGQTFVVRNAPRRGWMPEGMLLGMYRGLAGTPAAV